MKSTMKFNEVSDATDCFSPDNRRLPNGWNLVVKRLLDVKQFKREFLLEIRILSKHRNRNIVPLLGFYIERNERILVYQYLSNGRLSKWLRPTWVARGLSWFHYICNLHVVHLNISAECVLLDKNFEPKISNFGKAKFMHPNMLGRSSSYEPIFKETFRMSLFHSNILSKLESHIEWLTRKTFKELSCSTSNASNLSGNSRNFLNAIEVSLIGEGFENKVYTLIKVACSCVQPFPDQRPTMLQVYNYMIDIWGERH
ncbi:Inactive leucine-rich repeat receptor-like protein kinase [Glycine soja]|uniref:Protein kinase domain-containing protein n=2 Tax=Glycine subgen. Soja TaxID=1462606 RepID=K7L2K3_SOYBN|nr:Inactive leucine-rich repeat receptor-like protein kinase [Glycine soja]